MENQVLVTFASKYGSTAEIAEKINRVLFEEGLHSEVKPVEQISDISQYNAIVLGSAVYFGKWFKPAATYLKNKEAELAKKDVWLFSSGPPGNEMKSLIGWRFPKDLQNIADRIKPSDIVVFNGSIDLNKLNSIEKMAMKALKAKSSDYRDWDAIKTWAKGIATMLKKAK